VMTTETNLGLRVTVQGHIWSKSKNRLGRREVRWTRMEGGYCACSLRPTTPTSWRGSAADRPREQLLKRDWPRWLNSDWFMSTTDDGHAPLRAKPLQPASPPRGSIPALA
jgi:hypothetical protein